MKRNQLFATAVIAVVCVAAVPAQAQILGGGLRGGAASMQSATFGGGFVGTRSAVNDQTSASASGHVYDRTHAISRASQAEKAGASRGMEAGVGAKTDAMTVSRRAVDVGSSQAAAASGVASASANRSASSVAAGVTTVGQSEASVGKLSNGSTDEVAGQDAVGTKPTSSRGQTASQSTATKPADSQRASKQRPETTGRNGSTEPSAKGKASAGGDTSDGRAKADAAASANASATF